MAPGVPRMQYHIFVEKSLNPMAPYHAPFGSRRRGWPKDSLPLEVFHNIAAHLSREDLLQMRMVNTEFERKISNIVFHAVVVPFRPEIYGMMIHDGPTPDTKIDRKGKAKAKGKSNLNRAVSNLLKRTFRFVSTGRTRKDPP